MTTSTKKALAIVWLAVVGFFGALACMGLICMSVGLYDPVTMDGVLPERVGFVRARFILVIVAALVSGFFAFRYVRKKRTRPSDELAGRTR